MLHQFMPHGVYPLLTYRLRTWPADCRPQRDGTGLSGQALPLRGRGGREQRCKVRGGRRTPRLSDPRVADDRSKCSAADRVVHRHHGPSIGRGPILHRDRASGGEARSRRAAGRGRPQHLTPAAAPMCRQATSTPVMTNARPFDTLSRRPDLSCLPIGRDRPATGSVHRDRLDGSRSEGAGPSGDSVAGVAARAGASRGRVRALKYRHSGRIFAKIGQFPTSKSGRDRRTTERGR